MAAIPAMPEPKATEEPPSRPPRISSNASQPGVPSSREYARCSPSTKFDAGHGGTFSGEPERRSRPAETTHDSTEPGSLALCLSYPSMSLLDVSEKPCLLRPPVVQEVFGFVKRN